MNIEMLIEAAIKARGNAYVPYSHYPVGAALLAEDGNIYQGCNMEIASYAGTICAERNVIAQAIAAGTHRFLAIAIVGNGENMIKPCGLCRQTLAEFCNPDMTIITAIDKTTYKTYSLDQLLPDSFSL